MEDKFLLIMQGLIMENSSDTQIEKKEVVKKRMTIVYALLGVAAAPVVHLWAFHRAAVFTMWGYAEDPRSGWYFLVPPLGAIVFGIAWSIFALVGWKHGNIGLRVGLSVVVWAFVAGVVISYWARLLLGF